MFTLDSIPSVMQTIGVQLVKMALVVTKYHNTTLRANHISPEIILSLVKVHVTTLSHMEFKLPLYQKKKKKCSTHSLHKIPHSVLHGKIKREQLGYVSVAIAVKNVPASISHSNEQTMVKVLVHQSFTIRLIYLGTSDMDKSVLFFFFPTFSYLENRTA